jgi:hypothetical protein
MRRRALAVCLGALLVLAGCAAPTAPTSPPPGLSADGVTDPPALVRAHTNALQSTPFTVRKTTTMRDSEGTFRVTTNRTWRMDPTDPVRGSVVSTTTTSGDAPERYARAPEERAAWRNGTTAFRRVRTGNGSSYRRVDLLNSSVKLNPALHRTTISRLADRSNATVERVTRDGAQFYRVAAALNHTHVATNVSMTLLVRPDGLVREIRTAQTIRYRSGPRRVTERIRFVAVGTTRVDRPEWVRDAAERTA